MHDGQREAVERGVFECTDEAGYAHCLRPDGSRVLVPAHMIWVEVEREDEQGRPKTARVRPFRQHRAVGGF